MQKPTIGRVVRYRLTEEDIKLARERVHGPHRYLNSYSPGDEVTATVVRVFEGEFPDGAPGLNLKCNLDGSVPDLWVTSRREGTEPGTWHWPERT